MATEDYTDVMDEVELDKPSAAPTAQPDRDMDGTPLPGAGPGPDVREPTGPGIDELRAEGEAMARPSPRPQPAPQQPAAPPQGGEDYTDVMDEVAPSPDQQAAREAADASFLKWKADNAGVSPDQALEVLRLSDLSGHDPGFVAQNLDAMRTQYGAEPLDWQGITQRAPALKDWLGEQGYRPAATKDDLDKMSTLEWAFKGPLTALTDGAESLWGSARKLADALHLGGEENRQKIEQLDAEQQDHGDYGAHNTLTKSMVGLAKTAPLLLLDQGVRFVVGATLPAAVAAGAEVLGAGPEDPVADVGAAGGAVLSEAASGEIGSFGLNAALSYADTKWELRKLKGPDGKPLDEGTQQVLAGTVGLINGGVMALAGVGGHLLGPGAETIEKDTLNREGIEAARRLLMQPGALAAIQRYARRFGVHEASALLVGAVQSGINDLGQQLAKVKTGERSSLSLQEALDTTWAGAWKTAQDMMLLSGVNAGMETRTDVRNAATARQVLTERGQQVATIESANRLQAINSAAQGKAVQGLPTKDLGDFLRKVGDQPVRIDRAAVNKLAQDRGVEPEELAKQIAGDDGSAWAEATRTGGELVATGTGYVDFARQDPAGAEALRQDARLNGDALTPRQHAENEAAFQRRAEELSKVPVGELDEGAQRVFEDYRDKGVGAGLKPEEAEASAKLVAAAAQSWAERFTESTGERHDPWDIYQLQDLRIIGPDGRTAGFDPRAPAPAQPAAPDHEAVADVRAKYEKLLNEPGQEEAMRRYYQDPVTGLRNERAAAVVGTDKPAVLHFGVEGIKYRNDDLVKGGHNKADELLRAVAAAAHQANPEVYRAGGDFAVPVADQAEADAFLEKVRAGLPKSAQGYGITGKVGVEGVDKDGNPVSALTAARTAHDEFKKGEEANKRRSPRGIRPKGLLPGQDAGTSIPGKKVQAELTEAHRNRFAALTSTREGRDEVFNTVHVEKATGLLTRQGFDARPARKYRAAIDLNGLKRVQEKLALHMPPGEAHAFGDTMLEQFGRMAAEHGGLNFDFAHDHGDEYLAQADDEGALKEFLSKVRNIARDTVVRADAVKDGESGTWTYKRLMFGFGTGETRDENAAERALNADKEALSVAGERGNEDQPERLFFTPGRSSGGREGDGKAGDVGGEHQGGVGGHDRGGDEGRSGAGGGEVRPARAGGAGAEGPGAASESGGRRVHAAPEVGSQLELQLHSRGDRGRIDFTPPGGGKRRSFDIHVLERADASTLPHETFHFLSEVLGDLAQRKDAPELIKRDYADLLKEMGYDSHEQRVEASKERGALDAKEAKGEKLTDAERARQAELHAKEEKVTEAFTKYVAEGQAPSSDLVPTFSRLRTWLADLYRKATTSPLTEPSPKAREVFGRILAGDAEVKRAQAAAEATRPWADLASKMSPEERKSYEETTARADERARTETIRKLAEANHRENVGHLKAERERLRSEAEADLDKDPVYRAIKYLQDGELPGGTPDALKDEDTGKPFKLDRAALVKKYDAETVRALPRGIFAPKDEGESADDLAELLGFQSGGELVQKLLAAQPRNKVVEARVNQQMEDLHGAALKDAPQALADEASAALHNDAALQKVLMERRKLMELAAPGKGGHALDLSPEYLKRTAEGLIDKKTVGELTGGKEGAAGYYLRAERTAAQRMRKAFEAGKYEDALAQNERVLVNMHLYREARAARERLETAGAAIQQSADVPWRTALGKADVALTAPDQPVVHTYLGAHDAILQAVNMMPASGAPDLGALDRYVAAAGDRIGFDPAALRDLVAHPTAWDDLTRDQAEQVLAAVKNIRHLANDATKITVAGRQQDKATWFKDAADRAAKTSQIEPRSPTTSGATAGEKLAAAIRGTDAYLTSIATYVDTLDGGDRNGPWHRLFIDEYRDAREKLVDLDKDIVGRVRQAMEQMPKSLRARADEVVPDLDKLLPPSEAYVKSGVRGLSTRSDLWVLFLNSGNADNIQRLRDGNGWSDEARQQALQHLTPEEAKFLQGLLDTIDSLHPELAKVYERRKGLPLGKVEATPITIRGETFRGGYFPIKYDPSVSPQGARQMVDVEKKLFGPSLAPPTPYSGHTKERMEKVLAPLSMEWGGVTPHLAQVAQDIAMGDFARKAGSVVADPRFAPIVDKALGHERTALFMPWLKDIANDRSMSAMAAAEGQPGFIRSLMAMGRSRYARGVMALNLPSMLAHLTDPLAALGDTSGPVEMAARAARIPGAYLKTLASWKAGPRDEWALSKEISYRDARETANIRKELERVKLPENVFLRGAAKVSDVAEHVSTLVRHQLDMFHSKVLWQVGFDEGIAKGMTREEAAKAGDDLLAKTLPSGDIAERPIILRSKHDIAAVVTFYGYANRMYQLWVHSPISRAVDAWTGPEATPMSRLRSAGDLAAKWITMGAIAALGAKLAGRGPTDDDDKKALLLKGAGATGWMARRILLEPTNTLPIIGPALEGLADGREVSVRTAPGAQVITDTASRLERAIQKAQAGEGGDALVWELLALTTGTLLGPTGQLERTGGYVRSAGAGELPPQGPGDVATGLIYGPPRSP